MPAVIEDISNQVYGRKETYPAHLIKPTKVTYGNEPMSRTLSKPAGWVTFFSIR